MGGDEEDPDYRRERGRWSRDSDPARRAGSLMKNPRGSRRAGLLP